MMTTEEYNDKPTGSCDGRDDLVSRLASLDVPLLQQPGPFTETRAIIREAAARIRQLEADARESALQYLSDTGQMADKVDALTEERDSLRAANDRADADRAAAVEAERERCIVAVYDALNKRRVSYAAKHDRALTINSGDAALYEHLATSQDWAATAAVAAIRQCGAA